MQANRLLAREETTLTEGTEAREKEIQHLLRVERLELRD